ncbi:MAG: sulfotransferase domain-containing protein [Flavobacteriales bacterium]|nr:sulfotransferase domain-containing protein [Flavobacteriales bacterium]
MTNKLTKAAMELNYLMYQMDFSEREDDIYIILFPKSGTTIMQMILYQLTTDSSMDFNHINDISPWIRNEAYENEKVKDLKSPRLIKTHDAYQEFDHHNRGKYVYVSRNPQDIAVSKYHQERDYKQPDLKFDEYVEKFWPTIKKVGIHFKETG